MGRPEVLTDFAAVEQLLPEWRALAGRSARSPLEAPDWQLPLARLYHARHSIRFLTWRHEGELVAVAPFSLVTDRPRTRPLRQLAMWGTMGPRLRGLVDVVAVDEHRAQVLDGLCGWLRASNEWDVMWIVRPQHGSPTPARLRTEAAAAGWRYAAYANLRSTTYQLDLPDSAEGWQRHLDAKDRRTMRARSRRFAEFRAGQVVPAVGQPEATEALDAVERLLTQRWGEREVNFRAEPRFRPLIHDAVPRLVAQGGAWISVARDDSGIVAGLVSLAQNGYAMSLMMAATPDASYRQFSLGDQIHHAAIGEAVGRGCHTYDLLWVGGYKETFWRARPHFLDSAVVGRGLVGRTAARLLARQLTESETRSPRR